MADKQHGVPDGVTVDEETGRPYEGDQSRVAEAFGPPAGFDGSRYSDEARGVRPEHKLPGVPAPGEVSGPSFPESE